MNKEDVYKEYHEKVLRYILGKNISVFDAEDLCQSVFLKIINNLDSFDENKASLSTWIYTVTQNTVLTFYRTQGRAMKKQGGGVLEEIGFIDTGFDRILKDESLEELASALEKLDERSRTLIVSIYYNGMTMKAASEQMHISYANAKIILKKAFAMLKSQLS